VVIPGRVYRRDNDATAHADSSHQVEGPSRQVDADITASADLKGTLLFLLARGIFGAATARRPPCARISSRSPRPSVE